MRRLFVNIAATNSRATGIDASKRRKALRKRNGTNCVRLA